jgi:zinc protease
MRNELTDVHTKRPITPDELKMAQDNQVLSLAGGRETMNALLGEMADMVVNGLPPDYFDTYAEKVRGLTERDMSTAAERLIHPSKLVWVVVGDRSKVEEGIRKLNLGDVKIIDADGNPVS